MAKAESSGGAIFSPPGIVCFPHVWEPFKFEGKGASQDPAYSLILCFPEGVDLTDLKKAVGAAALTKFDRDEIKRLSAKGKFTLPWRDGSDYSDYGEPFVKGATFISFKSKNAPGIVNEWSAPITDKTEFYAGCWARVSALPWPYDSMGNQGVTFLLNNIQKTDDGEKLAEGKRAAEDEFEPVKKGAPPAGKGFEPTKGKGKGAPSAAIVDDDDNDMPF